MIKRRMTAVACIIVGLAGPARGQISVDSLTADFNAVKDLAGQAKAYALQANQYITEAQQLAQMVQQYAAFVQQPTLGAAVGLMGQAGLDNDLPINPASLMSLTSGYSMSLAGLSNKLATLGTLSNASYDQNHIYACTDSSFACTQQKQRGYGIAGSAGIAQSAYQDLRNHMPVVQALRDRAATAVTPAERENVALALQSETTWNDNLSAQIQAAEMQAKADEASLAQQGNEQISKSIEQTISEIP